MSLQALSKIWNRFTAPHPSIVDIKRRRQSRLLANFALVLLLFQLLTAVLVLNNRIPATGIRLAVIAIIVGITVYLLNRSAHYVVAAHIFVVILFITAVISLTTESHANIYYVAMVILVSAMLLSPFVTFLLFTISVILEIIFVANTPNTFVLQSFQPLIYTILSSIIILVFMRYRANLEQERQAELRNTIGALKKSEARWRSLVENAPDYILELDNDYRIRYINRTQDNVSPELMAGKSIFDFVAAEDHDQIMEAILRAIQTRTTTSFEGVGYSLTKLEGLYSTLISPIIREDHLDGIMLMSRDVSERVRVEQQRLELSIAQDRVRVLNELIGDLSHDLKTPLTIIKTSLYLLENLNDPQQQRDKLGQITEQTMRLEKIIQDILTLSKLDKAPQLSLTALNVNQLAGEIEKQLRPVADSKGVTLKLDLRSDLTPVQGDEEALRRALINLVENALNYTVAPGEVHVRTDQRDYRITIEVRDTGIGIAIEDIPHIFDRFYRATKARRTVTSGTGLGLAIVKKTIEMHNGSIEVSSQVGSGTTFRISLPTAS